MTWDAHADRLAEWTLTRCVNRADAWGAYYADAAGTVGPYTAKAEKKGPLDVGRLARHFRAGGPADVVGVHALSPGDFGRWAAVDIDRHGDEGDPYQNEAFAFAVGRNLKRLGLDPLVLDSNGKGGFHVWVFFADPVPGELLYLAAKYLARDHKSYGFTKPPETFPKQSGVGESGFGNWLRLPGRHPKRGFWCRVLDCDKWRVGANAAELILSRSGVPFDRVPTSALVPEPSMVVTGRANIGHGIGDGSAPWVEFNRAADWTAILEPHGWKQTRSLDGGRITHWTRPNKDAGTSATLGYLRARDGTPLLYVFSTSAGPLDPATWYTPAGALAVLEYRGDFRACARALRVKGYGKKTKAG